VVSDDNHMFATDSLYKVSNFFLPW